MSPFLTLVIALTAYRATRLATRDDFPPIVFIRLRVRRLLRSWGDLVECCWCAGLWASFATVAGVDAFASVPLPWLQASAVATVVGLIGDRVDHA